MSCGDLVVQMRMLALSDHFAYDAKYHRSCYATYIGKRNVSAANRKLDDSQQQTIEDPAFEEIVQQVKRTVVSSQKSVTTLAQCSKSRAARDEDGVCKVVETVLQYHQNPFDLESVPSELINIATGKGHHVWYQKA